ncbi:MAG: Arc family DNA-binding protein [Pseudomonadota bacterium]
MIDPKEKPHKFVVRLPLRIRDQIAEAAAYYRRSMNSEIVARLEQSFSGIPSTTQVEDLAPDVYPQLEYFFGRTLSSEEEDLVRAYRHLSQEKKHALLELLS